MHGDDQRCCSIDSRDGRYHKSNTLAAVKKGFHIASSASTPFSALSPSLSSLCLLFSSQTVAQVESVPVASSSCLSTM